MLAFLASPFLQDPAIQARPDLEALMSIIRPFQDEGTLVGVYLVGPDGSAYWNHYGTTRMIPASNMKVFSCAYALHRLGADYRSKTRIWKSGTNLIVDSPGDPTLSFDQLTDLRKKLGKASAVEVRQAYRVGVPPTWEHDDLPNRYAAQVSAFTVDRGGFELWSEGGKPVLKPYDYGVRILRESGTTLKIDYDPFSKIVRVKGPIPKTDQRMDTLAIPQPDAAAAGLLGQIPVPFRGELPASAPTATLTSPPLIETVKDCLVRSDNNIAENLMLMAAASEGPLGDNVYADASARMKNFLVKTVGLAESDIRVLDGSGMSRQNWVTPKGLVTLLAWAKSQWGNTWTDALAEPGKGTLAGRLEGSPFRGKTGTLTGVSTLSGYTKTADGRHFTLAVMFNMYMAPAADIRAAQDRLVREIENLPGENAGSWPRTPHFLSW